MKSKILKIIAFLGVLIGISAIALVILLLTGVVRWNGGIEFNTTLFESVKQEWWFILVFIAIQVAITTFMCFIPATSMMFIIGGVALFGANWKTFLICFSGVLISSLLMYTLGRFGGEKLAEKIVGKDDTEKATKLLREKGTVYFPAMMMCAGFPDDALCCVAGIIRMNPLFYSLSILLGRGIGCATIVFGISIVPFDKFTTIYDWIVFITVCAFWIIVVIFICRKINKWLEKKRKSKIDKMDQ